MAAGKRPILDGDIVIVDKNDKGYNTASVVARLHDDSYVVKMLKDDRFGKLLQSRNPEHTNGTPSAIPISEVAEIVGRVVRIVGDVDSRDQLTPPTVPPLLTREELEQVIANAQRLERERRTIELGLGDGDEDDK